MYGKHKSYITYKLSSFILRRHHGQQANFLHVKQRAKKKREAPYVTVNKYLMHNCIVVTKVFPQ